MLSVIVKTSRSVVVFAVVAVWGRLAYQPQFLENKHMMGPVTFLPGHQNTRKWTMCTLNIDVRPPTFIFVCIFSREVQFSRPFLRVIPNSSIKGRKEPGSFVIRVKLDGNDTS